MKKIGLITILVLGALFTSCSEPTTVETRAEGNRVIRTRTYGGPDKSVEDSFKIEKIMYEGHEYLYFFETRGYAGYAGITHSGTCPCHNK